MAKTPNAVIGLEIGRGHLRAVAMNRRGPNRIVLTDFAVRESSGSFDSADKLADALRELLGAMGGGTRVCAVAASAANALIRIIEQPQTPPEILRDAVRLNGQMLLNQNVADHVIDCAEIPQAASRGEGQRHKYLVGALPRKQVALLDEAFGRTRLAIAAIQIAPVATFNAFSWADPETFANDSFLLVDIGHNSSTVSVGGQRELVLVRTLEYGMANLAEAMAGAGAANAEAALRALDDGDDALLNAARFSVLVLAREISSSIGFFEGRREQSITRIHVSGGIAGSRAILQLVAEELHLPCLAWDPFARCEISLPESKRALFRRELVMLNAAAGAATQVLRGKQ